MNIQTIKYYLKIWWMMNIKYILPVLTNNLTFTVFLLGKIFRFIFFGGFLYFLLQGTGSLAGYNLNQTIFFYLTFNLIDVITQFLFREVYRFRQQIISGSFDLVLLKPMSALFRSLLGGADAIDLLTLPPLLILLWYFGSSLDPTTLNVIYYLVLVIGGIVMSAAFHIFVLSFAIITLEVDHTIMIYRDLTALGRLPIEIYKEPLRGFLTFIVPVALMISFPAKALMGLANPLTVILTLLFAGAILFMSQKFWQFALKKYSSASS